MNLASVVKDILNDELKNVHVAFLAEILIVSGNKAKIQPLGLTREYGGKAQKQAPIDNVHIAQSARCKFVTDNIEFVKSVAFGNSTVKTESATILKTVPIQKGDIVLCVCCDRNIEAALKGENSLPPVGCHNQSDCVIVAII